MLFFPTLRTTGFILSYAGLQRYIFFLNISYSGLCISSYLGIYSPLKIKRFGYKVITVGCTTCCYHERTVAEYSSRNALGSLQSFTLVQHQFCHPSADDTRFKYYPTIGNDKQGADLDKNPLHQRY